jgi:hypothetical protein
MLPAGFGQRQPTVEANLSMMTTVTGSVVEQLLPVSAAQSTG